MQILYVVNPNHFSKSTTKAWNKPMFIKIYTHLFKTRVLFCFFMWHFDLKTCRFSQKAQLQLNMVIPTTVQVAF